MKLRRKLIALELSVVAALATLVGVLIVGFIYRTRPLLEQGIETKTRSCLHRLQQDADVAIAASDKKLMAKMVKRCDIGDTADEDLRFVAILDAKGQLITGRGALPKHFALPGGNFAVEKVGGAYRGRTEVSIEGMPLGYLVTEFSTARILAWKRLILIFSLIALVLVALAALAAVVFALHLIRPLRGMIAFVHQVARGELDGSLKVAASDEMATLAADLETMTHRLREHESMLAEVSRSSGMAEVATSVLHNVGNVLNSVNVSANLMGERLRESRIGSLVKANTMLQEQGDTLAEFLTNDPRGKKLPHFFQAITQHLEGEHAALLTESQRLLESIDHIKAIVAAQQEHAKARDYQEMIRLDELLETALKISPLEGLEVEIARDYQELPALSLNRHKLLQVLTNLLSNARDAMAATPHARLALKVGLRDDGAFISIGDNGVGISAEDHERVFEHGFSTKEGGHGFGLHASANAVTELGGHLGVSSPGKDQGATFTVSLPMEEQGRPRH